MSQPGKHYNPSLHVVLMQHVGALKELVDFGRYDPAARGEYGENALHIIAVQPHLGVDDARRVLLLGVDPNARDSLGHTPAQLARIYGKRSLAAILDSASKSETRRR